MKTTRWLWVVLFSVAVAACGGGGSQAANANAVTASATMAVGVVAIDQASGQTSGAVVSSSASSITFSGSPAWTSKLQPGSVFTIGNDARKVVSITAVNGNTVIQTNNPAVDEVFSKIDISGQVTLTSQNIVPKSIAAGVQIVAPTGPDTVIGTLIPAYSADTFSVTIQNEKLLGLNTNGVIKFGKPLLKFDYHREYLKITSADIHFTSNADIDLNFNSTLSQSGNVVFHLFDFTVPILVAGVPTGAQISVPVNLKLDAALNGEITIGFTDAAVMDVRASTLAPSYQLTVVNNSTNNFSFKTPTLKSSLTLGAYIQPDIKLKLLSLDLGGIDNQLGMSATGAPVQDFGGRYMNCIHITADAKASSTAYFNIPVAPDRVQADIFNKTWNVYDGGTGVNGVCSISISPVGTTLQQGATSQLQLVVTDLFNKPVLNVPTLLWSSVDPTVATVSTTGLVTGVGAGSTTITVWDTNSMRAAIATITVISAPAPTPTPTPAPTACISPQVMQNGVCVSPPSINSLSLASVPADSVGRTLVIYGNNFATGNVVQYRWSNPIGGSMATATVVSAAQISVPFNPGSVTDTIYVKVCQSSAGAICSGELPIVVTAAAQLTPTAFTLSNRAPLCDTNPPAGPAVWIDWTPSSNATSYDVYRNGILYSPGVPSGTYSFYNNANLVAGQSYSYQVVAKNSSGTASSNSITVSVPGNICPVAIAPPPNFAITSATAYCDTLGGTATGAVQLNWGASSTATSYDIIRDGVLLSTVGATQLSFLNNATNLAGQTHSYLIRAHNAAPTATDTLSVSVTVPANICPVAPTLAVNGMATNYIGTGQKTIPLSGSGFSSITQISWSCTMPDGITPCAGSPYIWTPGTARWNNVTISSDTAAIVYPTFLTASDLAGIYNWSVTFSGAGQTVTKYFTATKY